MKKIFSFVVTALLALPLLVAPTWAGTSTIYWQAGQAEVGATNMCAPYTQTYVSDGHPETTQLCVMGTNDLMYFSYNVPSDFNAAASSGTMTLHVQAIALADNSGTHQLCFKASNNVYSLSTYPSSALSAPGGTPASGIGPTNTGVGRTGYAVSTGLSFYDLGSNAICTSTNCNNMKFTSKVQFVPCGGGADWTSPVGVEAVWLTYSTL